MVSLLLSFLLQHPDVVANAGKTLSAPRSVNTASMQESFADMAKSILGCYHHTARYQFADIVEKPWDRQGQYGADQSALIRIQYTGISKASYEMTVAVLNKNNMVRTAVLTDTAKIPYQKKCQLEQWTDS